MIFHCSRKIRKALEELVLFKSFMWGWQAAFQRFFYVSIKYSFDCSVAIKKKKRKRTRNYLVALEKKKRSEHTYCTL